MKKLLQIFVFCLLSFGLHADNHTNFKTISLDSLCAVNVYLDSSLVNGAAIAVAEPIGTAPFTYIWSTGETTASVEIIQWGVNYCVTVTDATGCVVEDCLFPLNSCSANVAYNPNVGLTALPNGVPPYTYLWSNASTAQTILPNANGTYFVTITDAQGCTATSQAYWGIAGACTVYIVQDSIIGGTEAYTAIPSGTPPFTYSWTPSGNTQTIPLDPAYFGLYCVTVTDANGNDCSACELTPCSVWIMQEDSAGMTGLFAIPTAPFGATSYLWSNGSTDDAIFPTTAGTYCVTITGGGCVASSCYQFSLPSNMQINGDIYHPDSLTAGPLEGIVELFYNDPSTNTWGVVATTTILSDPNGWWNSYAFGNQTNPGEYLVKVTLDPASPYAADFLPTYHQSSVLWDEANIITLPSSGSGLYNVLMSDGQNLTSGTGSIYGTVTEGDGLTANEEGDRGGDPRPNTSILLFDSFEQPITHTVTDAQGNYSFTNLPFGTYKLQVEIVGLEQADHWVSLSANYPSSHFHTFEVTENGIVSGIEDAVEVSTFSAFPNPTGDKMNLSFTAKTNFDAQFSVARTDGTTVLVANQAVVKGVQNISLDLSELPTGLYLLQVTTGDAVISRKIAKL